LDGGSGEIKNMEEKPTLSESKAVILAVFCSFTICMILFLVLWFGRDLEHCDNSFVVTVYGSVTIVNPPIYPIVVRGSNTPLRFAIQPLGKQVNISYGICRSFDDGTSQCINQTKSGSLIEDTFVQMYDADPCHEDNSTGLWVQIYTVSPSPIVLMYCFATDDVYAPKCLQRATASPMPLKDQTPAAEADTDHSRRRSVATVPIKRTTQMDQQRFIFANSAFSGAPDWNQFTVTYAWDPLDGYLPQYLPINPQFAFCGQSMNFRKLDLSYRACYNDLSTTPGRLIRHCTPWTDTSAQWFINDTLPYMPTAQEGSVVFQIQAADGPFIAAVGVKPDIDLLCGTDGSGNLIDNSVNSTNTTTTTPTPMPTVKPTPTPTKATTH